MPTRNFDIASIEKKLNTSAESGLSRRRARERLAQEKRRDRSRDASLYLSPKVPFYECFLRVFKSPAFDLLLLSALLSLAFGRYPSGVCLVFAVIILFVLSGTLRLLAERSGERLNVYSNPTSRVVREGKRYLCDCRNVVAGDLIELSQGDLVPCDARVVESEKLSVEQIVLRDGKLASERLEKSKVDDVEIIDITKSPCILLSGSRVLSGRGRAIVLATGENTYLGSRVGPGAFAQKDPLPESVSGAERIANRLEVAFAAVGLVSVLVGMFTLREGDLADVFLVVLAALSALSAISVPVLGRMIYSSRLERAAQNGIVVKNNAAADSLCSVSDIFLAGKIGVSDGCPRPYSVFTSGKTFGKESFCFGNTGGIAELIYIYLMAAEGDIDDPVMSEEYGEGFSELLRASGIDEEKLRLKHKSLYYKRDAMENFSYTCAETVDECYRICLTFNRKILASCEDTSFDAARNEFIEAEKRQGRRVLYVASEKNRAMTLEGMISFGDGTPRGLAEAYEEFKKMNIRVISLLDVEDAESLVALEGSELGARIARASEFSRRGMRITDGYGDFSAYVGFTLNEYAELLSYRQGCGGKVAVYAVENRYYPLLSRADLSISCDMINYGAKKYPEALLEKVTSEGEQFSLRCSQFTRISCGALVRRGDGLSGILRARKETQASLACFSLALLCVMLAAFLPASLAIASAISGIFAVSYPSVILLSAELGALLALLFSSEGVSPIGSKDSVPCEKYDSLAFIRSHLYIVISPAPTAILYVALIAVLGAVGFYEDLQGIPLITTAAVILTVALELVLILKKHTSKGKFALDKMRTEGKKHIVPAVILSLVILISFMLLPLFPSLREIYGFIGVDVRKLLLLPGYLLLYLACRAVVEKIVRSDQKK